jgi:1-deoxy-D-xylulose-5-phosphate synthase
MSALAIGKAEFRVQGQRIALLAFGTMVTPAVVVGAESGYSVVNMRFVKPLDTELIDKIADSHDLIITIEENATAGGAGAGVAEYLLASGNKYCRLDEAGVRARVDALVEAEGRLLNVG